MSIASDLVAPITDYFSYNAQNAAMNKQLQAIRAVQGNNIGDLNDTASQYDEARYKAGFSTQAADDPQGAALRSQGNDAVLQGLIENASGNSAADVSLRQLQAAASQNDAQMSPQIEDLLGKAKSDLAAGATLPPEYQAELVRAGLANASQTGYNLDGSAVAGSNIRTLLGAQGIALSQSRNAEAQGLLGTASNLQAQRANILSNLVTLDTNLRTSKAAAGINAAQLGNSSVPSIGISGADAANLQVGNTNLNNSKILSKGKIKGMKDLNNGQFLSNEVNDGAKIISDVASAYFGGGLGGVGGAAGGAAGGSGGAGSFLSGFLNNQGVSYMQSAPKTTNSYTYGQAPSAPSGFLQGLNTQLY